jgi:hypothetical protein
MAYTGRFIIIIILPPLCICMHAFSVSAPDPVAISMGAVARSEHCD